MTTFWREKNGTHEFVYVNEHGESLVATATVIRTAPFPCIEVQWILDGENRAYETLAHAKSDVARRFKT